MKFLTKLERKFGKYSIPNLTTMLILGFVVGLVMEIVDPSVIYMVNLDPQKILQGQVWRLISWVLMPPSGISILIILTLMFYWFVGRTLERESGEFRNNLYIFSDIIFLRRFYFYNIYVIIYDFGFFVNFFPDKPKRFY